MHINFKMAYLEGIHSRKKHCSKQVFSGVRAVLISKVDSLLNLNHFAKTLPPEDTCRGELTALCQAFLWTPSDSPRCACGLALNAGLEDDGSFVPAWLPGDGAPDGHVPGHCEGSPCSRKPVSTKAQVNWLASWCLEDRLTKMLKSPPAQRRTGRWLFT